MLVIKDDFLEPAECSSVYEDSIKNKSVLYRQYNFFDRTLDQCLSGDDFVSKCITFASKHYDLSSMVGFEIWYNYSIPPNHESHTWHIDKDEVLYEDESKFSFPLCTVLYYPFVEKENGGELVFKDYEVETLQPKTNRVVCFDPGIEHKTNLCDFKRISISIAPWQYKVKKWIHFRDKEEKFMQLKIDRKCDGCTMCCQGWLTGDAFGKTFYPGKPCHFIGSTGCTIYENRPHNPCITFRCGWLDNPEIFPEWLKPNLSKVLVQEQQTKNGINYFKIFECGQKIDSTVYNYLVLHALNNGVNMSIQVSGGWSNFGTQQFLEDVNLK